MSKQPEPRPCEAGVEVLEAQTQTHVPMPVLMPMPIHLPVAAPFQPPVHAPVPVLQSDASNVYNQWPPNMPHFQGTFDQVHAQRLKWVQETAPAQTFVPLPVQTQEASNCGSVPPTHEPDSRVAEENGLAVSRPDGTTVHGIPSQSGADGQQGPLLSPWAYQSSPQQGAAPYDIGQWQQAPPQGPSRQEQVSSQPTMTAATLISLQHQHQPQTTTPTPVLAKLPLTTPQSTQSMFSVPFNSTSPTAAVPLVSDEDAALDLLLGSMRDAQKQPTRSETPQSATPQVVNPVRGATPVPTATFVAQQKTSKTTPASTPVQPTPSASARKSASKTPRAAFDPDSFREDALYMSQGKLRVMIDKLSRPWTGLRDDVRLDSLEYAKWLLNGGMRQLEDCDMKEERV